MPFFEWSDELDTNVDSMNKEHQTLINLMNKLYDLNSSDAPKDEIKKAFDEFASFTIKHFKDEEEYMASINYEKLEVHKKIHEDLLKKVTEFKTNFEQSQNKLENSFFSF